MALQLLPGSSLASIANNGHGRAVPLTLIRDGSNMGTGFPEAT